MVKAIKFKHDITVLPWDLRLSAILSSTSGNSVLTFRDNLSVVPSTTSTLKMGPIGCPRNVSTELPRYSAQYSRRSQISSASRWEPEIQQFHSPFFFCHNYLVAVSLWVTVDNMYNIQFTRTPISRLVYVASKLNCTAFSSQNWIFRGSICIVSVPKILC
jgi:hypothetical protein